MNQLKLAIIGAMCVAICGCGGSGSTSAQLQTTAVTTTSTVGATTTTTIASAADWLKKNAQAFSSTDPAVNDDSDLQKFGDAIGDARIVSLAEPDHGSGTVFDMKARLVKYLHEKKGFDVLMVESSMFAVNRVWQLALTGQKVDDLAPDNIFYMYSKSAEGRKTLQYIDAQRATANPLILSSFETVGTSATYEKTDLFPMIEAFLTSRGSLTATTADWGTYKYLMLNNVIANTGLNPNPTQQSLDTALLVSGQLSSELCATQTDSYVFPASPGIWCRIFKGLESTAGLAFSGKYTRETVAVANFKWLDDHIYSGHKIILWGHYQHLGRGTQSPQAGGVVNMGNGLNALYGKKMYVAAFTSSFGSELAWWNGASTTDTSPVDINVAGSMEDILHQLSKPNLFVDARLTVPPSSISTIAAKTSNFIYSYLGFTNNTTLGDAYDGLFYIETSKPTTMNR